MNHLCLSLSAATLSLCIATPIAAGPAIVEIKQEVQEIAMLSLEDGSVSTIMDDPNPTSVGDPSAFGPTPGMAQLELATNFCVGLQFDFPTVQGIRPYPVRNFGQAVGLGNGNTLGVQPFVRIGSSWANNFGDTANLSGSTSDAPISLSAQSGNLCDGYHDIFLGLVTQWDLTLNGEPIYAEPDTYRIPITVSLLP